ncbi:acyl-CoA dehydrogenase family protein [Roseococcus sp. SDR]|uniref:acyl-CoA dehydrogenase n=1 Tax=Roseococcus sp. SDR TaxID=2835532 RepID=UPI001BCF71B9|nr:acyl-CoA dehydrogenase [Roseococcus sp. SDR]MBS7789624.1 acyl-CoA dehydrogenase family protein [Roseococcus sp. SDR]MBV1844938.1 acyl-CoA dehydrogenase family protein [Roseococcus sp. SDR]
MSELRSILVEQVDRLMADGGGVALLRTVEAGEWPAGLWAGLEEQGLNLALVPEEAGGVGLSWGDAAALWQVLGRHGAPAPIAETMLGAALLSAAGIEVPEGPIGLAQGPVPFGRHAARLVVPKGAAVTLHATGQVTPGENIGREPRDAVTPGDRIARGELPNALGPRAALLGLALIRAALIAGALERILALAVDWANTRKQFGRAIGKFQAVQQQLAAMAGEVAAVQVAVQAAARAVDARGLAEAGFEIGCAKVVAGEAATMGAATVHQVFAAIGITEDHELHHFTRRLWAWREEGGTERFWATEIGRDAMARGGANLWPDITARDAQGAD